VVAGDGGELHGASSGYGAIIAGLPWGKTCGDGRADGDGKALGVGLWDRGVAYSWGPYCEMVPGASDGRRVRP
jgi:hypothetical protein